jgi:hypothetical protein
VSEQPFGLVGGSLRVQPSREGDRARSGDGGLERLTRSITSVMNDEAAYAEREPTWVEQKIAARREQEQADPEAHAEQINDAISRALAGSSGGAIATYEHERRIRREERLREAARSRVAKANMIDLTPSPPIDYTDLPPLPPLPPDERDEFEWDDDE